LTPAVGPTALPFITFFPAVAWAAWYGGLGPGVLSVVLAGGVAKWFFLEPLHTFRIDDPIAFVAFPLAAAFIVAAIETAHRVRRDLAKSHDLLATTLTSIGDGVVVTDAAGDVTFLNPEAERLTGWKTAEAAGRPLSEVFRIVNEQTRREVESPVARVLRDGKVVGLANHTVVIAKDGFETPIDDSAAPVREPGEPIMGVVLVFRDVRAQRDAEVAKARLAAIVENSGDAILSKDINGIVLTWNAAAERLFGYRADEIVGRSIEMLVPEDHKGEERTILDALRAGRPSELVETTRVAKDGRRIPVSVRVSPLRDGEGEVIGASKIVRDLSDLVAARDALARERDLLGTTLSSIGDGVIATDALGRVTFLNPVAQELTGWSQAEAAGQPLQSVFRIVHETTRAEVENPALRAMRDGMIVGLANHTVLLSRSGEERAIDDSAAPIRGAGVVIGSVLVFRDVTERRAAERALREADQRKDEFIATLAHELRNPLAPIKNSVTLLQLQGPPDEALATARGIIERQVDQISRLLDDLLDVNRLGRRKLELRKEHVTLDAIFVAAMETARPGIEARCHSVTIDVPKDIVLNADPVRLSQVFANLLSNAAKYMDDGGQIWVSATRERDDVHVVVKDTGIGIAPDSLPTLFEVYAQAPLALERAQGGVGIGLSLAKGLVELHGGTISARSDGIGKGSEFLVRLPMVVGVVIPKGSLAQRLGRPHGVTRTILVADDLPDNADTLATLLRALGHDVHVAYDGAEAIMVADRVRPEVAVIDIGMPRVNGYDVARRIREQDWGKAMYLIAQTGWGQAEDRRRAEQAGFDRHMLKPVDCASLVVVLSNLPIPMPE
jgi:PAS domain S-box-containing protein